jgi:hypothetical protein
MYSNRRWPSFDRVMKARRPPAVGPCVSACSEVTAHVRLPAPAPRRVSFGHGRSPDNTRRTALLDQAPVAPVLACHGHTAAAALRRQLRAGMLVLQPFIGARGNARRDELHLLANTVGLVFRP